MRWLNSTWAYYVVSLGAMTAMLGVVLSLILGLSRMVLAMARRYDMPVELAKVHTIRGTTTPVWAVLVVSGLMMALALTGNIKTTWSFSAFTVLVYYAVCNLAAIRLPAEKRLYPKWLGYVGMVLCVVLAFFVEWQVWLVGLGMIAVGLVWHWLFQRYYKPWAMRKAATHEQGVALVPSPATSPIAGNQVAPSK